ncbi:MAG: hypothetical protein QGH15_24075, partial [Kiritimatiellia bacterium]|nr:hypothetical protein [Kiritimatiellia bacterium]
LIYDYKMSINVYVCKDTLNDLEEYLDSLKLDILHKIGKKFLDKKDYRDLIRWYSDDFISNMIDIIKVDILCSIGRNYCDKRLTEEMLIDEFL